MSSPFGSNYKFISSDLNQNKSVLSIRELYLKPFKIIIVSNTWNHLTVCKHMINIK